MRERRIANEWKLLSQLEQLNPAILKALRRGIGSNGDFFEAKVSRTPAPVHTRGRIQWVESHSVVFTFPQFFPALPIEANLAVPVFHPNVDPENGFVCLWTRTCSGDTIAEAITRLRQVISWNSVNYSADHVMQPDAIAWKQSAIAVWEFAANFEELVLPECLSARARIACPGQIVRRRLS